MKYDPRNISFITKKQLEKYSDLLKYDPKKDKYICSICNKKFLTSLGGYNHIDYKHEDKIMEIKNA